MIDNWEKPRNTCFLYFIEKNIKKPILLTKEEFDNYFYDSCFSDGPHRESFGTGYGEPYNPWTQAFGILKDGRGVFCELYKWPTDKHG